MDSNITEQQYSDDNLQLAEPHFDEEATMLSARPVVPLEEIKEASSRRRLSFGLAMLASVVIGGLAASLIFKQRAQVPAAEVTNSAIAGSGASATDSPIVAFANGGIEGEALAVSEAPQVPEETKAQAAVTRVVKPPQARIVRRLPANTAESFEEQPLSWAERREMRRTERLEERRLRRQAAREDQYRGGRRRRSADDLLRIREIFEGSRRP